MEEAKSTVKKFMSNSGKHDTTVHERVAPAVTQETIAQKQHEQKTTAVDREVHQDHYHTSEQPVSHSEVLPEQHHHQAAPVEHRSFEHDNADKIKRGLEDERKQYYDTQTRVEGEKTRSENPVVQGEHVHHHVHETIQPVVNKQTVEPHVVHTTVPIHEVHHNEAHHHAASALPAVSMDEFKRGGGSLGGREERTEFFKGEPKSIHGREVVDNHGHETSHGTTDHTAADPRTKEARSDRIGHDSRTEPSSVGAGAAASEVDGRRGLDTNGHSTTGSTPGSTLDHSTSKGSGHTFGTMEPDPNQHKKPSLLDKLNPKKDADGDGKPGFMK